MNETDFQALFDSYQEALRMKSEHPVPQKLHLMIYNYARLRHQQTSDVSADFYLQIVGKVEGILERYDPRRLPFYQYMASTLNFEFSHFLRRRRLPRSQIELLSTEELAERRIELATRPTPEAGTLDFLMERLKPGGRHYAKLALAVPLTFRDLRQIIARKRPREPSTAWGMLRAYRAFLRFSEDKRARFLTERDRLMKTMMQLRHMALSATPAELVRLNQRRQSLQKKFFSMDTRIPIRIVAAVTGDSIATAQRQLKKAVEALKKAYSQWEKQKLGGKKRTN